MPRVASLAVLLTLMAGTLLWSAAAQGQEQEPAEEGLSFTVQPAPDASTADTGGYFVIDADAGGEVSDQLVVRNASSQPIDLQLAAVDATTGVYGGVSYDAADEPAERVGAWISLDEEVVSLAPDEEQEIGFTVEVPDDAASGVHIAGLAAWVPDAASGDTGDDAGVAVDVQRRRVVAVQLVLPGPAEPLLRVTGIEPAARADGVYLLIGIANEGHGFATGEGTVQVEDPAFRQEFSLDTFVPGTEISYPVRFADTAEEREYAATVRIDYGGASEEWEGTFLVGPELTEELQDRGGASPGLIVERAPPWRMVAGVLVIALAGLAVWALARWFRKRAARAVSREDGQAPDEDPTGAGRPDAPTAGSRRTSDRWRD